MTTINYYEYYIFRHRIVKIIINLIENDDLLYEHKFLENYINSITIYDGSKTNSLFAFINMF